MAAGLYRKTCATRPGEAPRYCAEGARHGVLCDDTVRSTRPATRHASARVGAATRHGVPAIRHGSVRAGWAKGGALCTRLSFESMHCSKSLFGHCSRGFQKKKNIYIYNKNFLNKIK